MASRVEFVIGGDAGQSLISTSPELKHVLVLAEKKYLSQLDNNAALSGLISSLNLTSDFVKPILDDAADAVSKHVQNNVLVTVTTFPSEMSRHLGLVRADSIRDAAAKFASKSGDVLIALRLSNPAQALQAACAVARAFPAYSRKSGEKDKKIASKTVTVHLIFDDADAAKTVDIAHIREVTENVRYAALLVDTPPNELHVDAYVDIVKEIHAERLQQHGVKLTLIQGEELREKGYGSIYGVGKASEHPPALAILSYSPTNAKKNVVFVGKGIVFDTGGLSIKGGTSMPTMKTDMGGSAGVFMAFVSAVTTGVAQNINLHVILCLAENSVDARSYRPDDILVSYSGKTIEINNTDAEGRLVLIDGIAHACKHLNPDFIIDMATLTGAQSYATGLRHAGILSNSEALEADLVSAGKRSGDLAFPFIYCPEYHGVKKHFPSDVADMKNSTNDRTDAPSAGAGHFIASHLSPEDKWKENGEGQWAHVDIAFPSVESNRGTGYGVALLFEFAKTLSAKL